MSRTLLQRVKTHVVDTGTLLSAYSIRYFKWRDTDLNGAGEIALFRTTGTNGQVNRHVQFPDVSLLLMASPANVGQADDDLLGVIQYLRANPSGAGAFNMFPVGAFTGPSYLENGRAIYELVIRTGTTDH